MQKAKVFPSSHKNLKSYLQNIQDEQSTIYITLHYNIGERPKTNEKTKSAISCRSRIYLGRHEILEKYINIQKCKNSTLMRPQIR